jgi:hypothetical protein
MQFCYVERIVASWGSSKKVCKAFVEVMAQCEQAAKLCCADWFSEDIVRETSRPEFWEMRSIQTVKNAFSWEG